MKTKHGGSEASGLVLPAGLEQHETLASGLVVPEIARTNEKAKKRAMEFERRRVALTVLPELIASANATPEDLTTAISTIALAIADDLITKTGGEV